MLTKEDLLNLGYEINPDPDQPGKFYWRNEFLRTSSGISFNSEDVAVRLAADDANETYELHRCDNCGKVHTDATLKIAKHLSQRIDPAGTMPSGECPDCGALCYPIEEDPNWKIVSNYFGLDNSFLWTPAHVADYTRQYLDAIATGRREEAMGKAAIELLAEVDAYLREIRAENLDGSEPALGELLDRTANFWIARQKESPAPAPTMKATSQM